jgi:hypothetical protein
MADQLVQPGEQQGAASSGRLERLRPAAKPVRLGGAFDEAAPLQPTRHIFPEERLPWLHLSEASEG